MKTRGSKIPIKWHTLDAQFTEGELLLSPDGFECELKVLTANAGRNRTDPTHRPYPPSGLVKLLALPAVLAG